MFRRNGIHVEAPRTGGGSVLGFVAIVICSIGALSLQAMEAEPRQARTVFLEQQTPWRAETAGAEQEVTAGQMQVDDIVVSSLQPDIVPASAQLEEPPLCNIAACTNAYRSFRAADCTFQPYEGPRRLCTR